MPITCKIDHISTGGDDGNMDTVHYSNHLLYIVVLEKGKKGVVFHHQSEKKAQPGWKELIIQGRQQEEACLLPR